LLSAGESSLALPLLKSECNNSAILCLLYGICALSEDDIYELDNALIQYSAQYLAVESAPIPKDLTCNEFRVDYTFIGIAGMEQVIYFFLKAALLIEGKKNFLPALQAIHESWQAWEYYNRTIRPFTWYELPDFFSGLPLIIAQLGLNISNLLGFNEERRKWLLRCKNLSHLKPISWYKVEIEETFVSSHTYSIDIKVFEYGTKSNKNIGSLQKKTSHTNTILDNQKYLISICLPDLPQDINKLHFFLSSVVEQAGYQNVEILCGSSPCYDKTKIKACSSLIRYVSPDQSRNSNLLDLIGESLGDYVAIITQSGFLSKAYLAQALKPLVAGDADIITFGGVRKENGACKTSVVARTAPLDLTCILRHEELSFASCDHEYIGIEPNELQLTTTVLPFGLITSRELLLQFISPNAPFLSSVTLMHYFGILAYLFKRNVAALPSVRVRDFGSVGSLVDKSFQAFEALSIGFLLYEENVFINKIVPLVKNSVLEDFDSAWATFISKQAILTSLQKKIWLTADRSLQGWWQQIAQCLRETLPLHRMIALSEGLLSDILPRINSKP
jgi:hypothetical protein